MQGDSNLKRSISSVDSFALSCCSVSARLASLRIARFWSGRIELGQLGVYWSLAFLQCLASSVVLVLGFHPRLVFIAFGVEHRQAARMMKIDMQPI